VKGENIRVIWQSAPFPTSSFALAHDLRPELAAKIRQCFFDYRFPEAMRRDLGGNDRFWPATYLRDWEPVRAVADAVNAPYTRANFDAEARAEEAAAARRAQQRQQQQAPAQGTPPSAPQPAARPQ
jgi:phosphonate transport system substrate-binding protein